MKNFTQLFDLERQTRDGKAPPPSALREQEAGADGPVVDFAASAVLRSPAVQVDFAALERAKILPPGAGGPYGPAYKMLRTQVLKRLDQLGANSLAVVSPCSADGKTLTAINLAITIAAATGRTALVVDFDLRNPNVHKRFGFQPEAGVEECLDSRLPLQNVMVRVEGYERLTLLPARGHVAQSSELLSAARVGELVAEMRSRYSNRVLIFDLPPVLQADDALAFSQHIQAALLVVSERHTKREDVTRTLELMRDTPVIGTVLNGSRTRDMRSY